MGNIRNPRRGSMQFWPRKRAARIYPKVRTWPDVQKPSFLGFAGYKAGMTHLQVKDNNPHSMTKDEDIFMPVTIIECPPIKIISFKFYKKSIKGLTAASEVLVTTDKQVARKIKLPKKAATLADAEKDIDNVDDVRVVVATEPSRTGIGKKKPEIFELGIGGTSPKEKLEFAKQYLDKEITINDVFAAGQQVDIKSVTKGKGFQGTTKRYGTKVRTRKAEKAKRGIGTLGPWHPAHVLFTVPQPGKMGYHSRTEYNKLIVKIGSKPEEINLKGGFKRYGLVKNNYILIKGTVAGQLKRLIRFNTPMRPNKKIPKEAPIISYTSRESKQRN
jgi:large subunit ribosomal protein L3